MNSNRLIYLYYYQNELAGKAYHFLTVLSYLLHIVSFGDEIGASIFGDVYLLSAGYFIIIIYVALVLGRFNCIEMRVSKTRPSLRHSNSEEPKPQNYNPPTPRSTNPIYEMDIFEACESQSHPIQRNVLCRIDGIDQPHREVYAQATNPYIHRHKIYLL